MQSAQKNEFTLDFFHKVINFLRFGRENRLILCIKYGNIDFVKKLTASGDASLT